VEDEDEDESSLSSLGLAMMNATTATITAPIRSPIRPLVDMAAAKYANRRSGDSQKSYGIALRDPDAER
jgi:hypothetical protein